MRRINVSHLFCWSLHSHVSVFSESEEALLKMSVSQPETGVTSLPDFSSMTEEEQIAYAMQMSLAGGGL